MVTIGEMYMLKGSFSLIHPFRIADGQVYYIRDSDLSSGSMPKKDFEKGAIRVIPYKRRRK